MIFLHEMARIIFKCIIRNVSLFRAIKMVREYYVLTVSPIYFFLNALDKEKTYHCKRSRRYPFSAKNLINDKCWSFYEACIYVFINLTVQFYSEPLLDSGAYVWPPKTCAKLIYLYITFRIDEVLVLKLIVKKISGLI